MLLRQESTLKLRMNIDASIPEACTFVSADGMDLHACRARWRSWESNSNSSSVEAATDC